MTPGLLCYVTGTIANLFKECWPDCVCLYLSCALRLSVSGDKVKGSMVRDKATVLTALKSLLVNYFLLNERLEVVRKFSRICAKCITLSILANMWQLWGCHIHVHLYPRFLWRILMFWWGKWANLCQSDFTVVWQLKLEHNKGVVQDSQCCRYS